MRKLFLISVLVFSVNAHAFSQGNISVTCDDTWGPGRYNKVMVTITAPNSAGFIRFSQDFPLGLDVIIDNPGTGDFSWWMNQLNVVWMKIPENRTIRFSYFARPERSMNGSFTMSGRLITVSEREDHKASFMKDKLILVGGINGLLPEQIKTGTKIISDTKPIGSPVKQAITKDGEIIFRVQVSVSSKRTDERELQKSLGLDTETGVRIIQSGKMYKYQAGNFSSYDAANRLLRQITEKGYKDAFIVAYRGGEQIPVEKARSSSK
jgi:hypothetical protein